MEEIGLQLETMQPSVIAALRRYVAQEGMRLIEECPLRHGLQFLQPATESSPEPTRVMRSESAVLGSWRAAHLDALFEAYFDFFFRPLRQRALLVGPTVGRWTAVLYGQNAVDCRLLRWLSRDLRCRAVGYCFVEGREYSYVEMTAGRTVEVYTTVLADATGRNYWSAIQNEPPAPGSWVREGFLKQRYSFIPGFYDLPFVRGQKSQFTCYTYDALPDLYDPTDNYPLSAFRCFHFYSEEDEEGRMNWGREEARR